MPQLWQCDVCGARYRVNWLSHCYRCEGRPPKATPRPEKPSRRKRMPRIVAGVGPSNARAEQEQAVVVEDVPRFDVVGESGTEFLAFPAREPVVPAVEPEAEPVVVEDAPAPVEAPAPIQDAPAAAAKGGAA